MTHFPINVNRMSTKTTDEAYSTVLAGVERALGKLGESGKNATLWHLSWEGVRKEEIPSRPHRFMKLLTEMFGPGAAVIESEIVRNIKNAENLSPAALTFAGVVDELKERGRLGRPIGLRD